MFFISAEPTHVSAADVEEPGLNDLTPRVKESRGEENEEEHVGPESRGE